MNSVQPEPESEERDCSCGARQYEGCFCGLTPKEFFRSLRRRDERRAARIAARGR